MSRYIDSISKEYALASACSGLIRTIDGEDWIRVSEVRESIMNTPPVDAVPVKHGHWIKIGGQDSIRNMKCSICGEEVFGDLDTEKYCFNCGAKMDESTQSNDSNTLDALGEKVTE